MEIIRKAFPPAWRSLHAAVPAYKATKSGIEKKRLEESLAALETLTRQLRDIWATGGI